MGWSEYIRPMEVKKARFQGLITLLSGPLQDRFDEGLKLHRCWEEPLG
jgi:hypothetical protein